MIVEITLNGQSVGTAEWSASGGYAVFQYSDEFRALGIEPSPIVMPVEGKSYQTNRSHIHFHNLPYLLSDSMPDDFGNLMMREWFRQRQLSYNDVNPVDRLTYVGKRGMGALEYEPVNHMEKSSVRLDVTELIEVARLVLEQKEKTRYPALDTETLSDILRVGTSAGGARAKALIAMKTDGEGKIEELRPGDIIQPEGYSYWILKFDGANEKMLGESLGKGLLEYAYYKLAIEAKIEMTECRLLEENRRFHFLTKRFDRTEAGGKIHSQTLGALAGIDYRVPKASSYETLFRVMKRLQLPYNHFEQQFRRMIFNVIARNQDDHVKNFSFLMDRQGKWSISPAYDLTFQYSPGGKWTNEHQTSINGKFDHFVREDLLGFGEAFGIKKAANILEEIIAAVSQWRRIAREVGIPASEAEKINRLLRLKDYENA